ncbi:MAG: CbiX/SirB N-terminal domain-containing protein [Planctomycetia bacterium]|jgi:sirohydrochlorin ferrochelatase
MMTEAAEQPLTAILMVDHGSRRAESNQLLHDAARRFQKQSGYSIVQPAHMELAEPSIRQAFDQCVSLGATRVVVFPWFLSPGRHWTEDIPELVQKAAAHHPAVEWLVTPPFGMHPGLMTAVNDRIDVSVRKYEAERVSDDAGIVAGQDLPV